MSWFSKNSIKVSDNGKHARRTGPGVGHNTSVTMPVQSNTKIDKVSVEKNTSEPAKIVIGNVIIGEIQEKDEYTVEELSSLRTKISNDIIKLSNSAQMAKHRIYQIETKISDIVNKDYDLRNLHSIYTRALIDYNQARTETNKILMDTAWNNFEEAKDAHRKIRKLKAELSEALYIKKYASPEESRLYALNKKLDNAKIKY